MLILKINTKSNIPDILNGIPSGILREYIYDIERKDRLHSIVNFTFELSKNNIQSYIEVKFMSRYSDREKRIEIVGVKGKFISLYKFSTFVRFDKDAIELDRILSELRETFNHLNLTFIGVLLFNNHTDLNFIRNSLKNLNTDIQVSNY